MYRYKTQDEFITEFGDSWRDIVKAHFVKQMDFLFGTKCPEHVVEDLIVKKLKTASSETEGGGWSISKDMITKIISSDDHLTHIEEDYSFLKVNQS